MSKGRPFIRRVEWELDEDKKSSRVYVNGERVKGPIRATIIEDGDGHFICAFIAPEGRPDDPRD